MAPRRLPAGRGRPRSGAGGSPLAFLESKPPRGDLQCLRDFCQHDDGGIANAPFDPTDVGAVELAVEGQLLLRYAQVLTIFCDVLPDASADIHPSKGLFCILLIYSL